MNKYTVSLLLVVASFSTPSHGEQLGFKFGLGMLDGERTAKIKTFSFRSEGYTETRGVASAWEVGLWTDTGKSDGRKGAAFYKYQVGFRPQSQHVFFKAMAGPALLSSTDSQLGAPLQIGSDFGVGFQDDESYVGLTYSHFSSAGVFSPNMGRDFILFDFGIRF